MLRSDGTRPRQSLGRWPGWCVGFGALFVVLLAGRAAAEQQDGAPQQGTPQAGWWNRQWTRRDNGGNVDVQGNIVAGNYRDISGANAWEMTGGALDVGGLFHFDSLTLNLSGGLLTLNDLQLERRVHAHGRLRVSWAD